MIKTYKEEYELMKKLASNHHQMVYERTLRKSTLRILQVNTLNAISAQISVLSKKMQSLEVHSKANAQMAEIMCCRL